MRPTLVVMLKVPRPGRVKTRLARDLGAVEAAWWVRHQTARLLRRLRDRRWRLVLAVSPGAEGLASRVWPADLTRIAQGRGDLGDRMGRILRHVGRGPLMIVGGDVPGLDRSAVAGAFGAMAGADGVIGPATDGGFWAIGLGRLRAVPSRLFAGVRWSGRHAMADTLATLPDHRMARARTLRDVDTLGDLRAMRT